MLDLSLTKSLDAICLGRAGMDLYAAQPNTDFADVTQFNKQVGGSPANIAVGMAKLGSAVGFIGKVSDDVVGMYVQTYLQKHCVNTDGLMTDATGTRTSLAVTEMRPDNCAVVIYRNNAADLALAASEISPDYIAGARMLVVSGTALSANPSRDAVFAAIEAAAKSQTKVVLDLDYRAYTWESEAQAASVYQRAAQKANMLIGNNEEFEVMGVPSSSSYRQTADTCLKGEIEHIMIKAGAKGSAVFSQDGDAFTQGSYPVVSQKPFGAGDAYAAAICSGLAQGLDLRECVDRGAAAAAIVVAGDACGESSPDAPALAAFMNEHAPEVHNLE